MCGREEVRKNGERGRREVRSLLANERETTCTFEVEPTQ